MTTGGTSSANEGTGVLFLTADGVVDHDEAVRDAWALVAHICQCRDFPVQLRDEVQATGRAYGDGASVVFAYSTLFLGSAVISPLVRRLIELGVDEVDVIDLVTEQMHRMMPSTRSG